MTLLEFIDSLASKALAQPDVFFKPGHNGPYLHPETPVRIKSHWLITFCKLYEWTGNPVYRTKAEELMHYLLSTEARPFGYSFYHRNKGKKDRCNGLVGQAWTFEALAQAARTFQNEQCIKVAEDVFLLHHFNEEHALWNILEIDGKILPIDNAPNHQLWFAASIGRLNSEHHVVYLRVHQFLDKFLQNATILDSGLIYHEFDTLLSDAYARVIKIGFRDRMKQRFRQFFRLHQNGRRDEEDGSFMTVLEKKEKLWDKMKRKSIGYHAFNMYALAMLKEAYPEHALWRSEAFYQMTSYLLSEEYRFSITENQFAFPYNPPGIEVPYALSTLKELDTDQTAALLEPWFTEQISRNFSKETFMFDRNNQDMTTLTARIYELTRFDRAVLEATEIYVLNKI